MIVLDAESLLYQSIIDQTLLIEDLTARDCKRIRDLVTAYQTLDSHMVHGSPPTSIYERGKVGARAIQGQLISIQAHNW